MYFLFPGFFHEQARDDRDRFVEVKWENILDGELLALACIVKLCTEFDTVSNYRKVYLIIYLIHRKLVMLIYREKLPTSFNLF